MDDSKAEEVSRCDPNQVVAIIPARGGSKGIHRKNISDLCGKPLIAYSIDAAKSCGRISRCIVSTEDTEIKAVSLQWGAEVIDRPCDLATDQALSKDVVMHVLATLDAQKCLPEYFVLLQPTSPLRTASHLRDCIDNFDIKKYNCAVSVTESEHHPYKAFKLQNGLLEPLYSVETLDQPRQKLPAVYRQNGAIYVLPSRLFLREGKFFIPPAFPYIMDQQSSIDIDSPVDLSIAAHLLRKT